MPKDIINNRINYQNVYGRVLIHDEYLSQGVKQGDSPTFSNLQLTGDATIQGNLYVEGNTTVLDSNIIQFVDNIILVNSLETGNGVTLGESGIEIDRGTGTNFRIIYDEPTTSFKAGFIGNLQSFATREDFPLSNGIMIWDPINLRINAVNNITIPITLSNTNNTTSPTTGALIINGGVGIEKDTFMGGKLYFENTSVVDYSCIYGDNNGLNISSLEDIFITPNSKIVLPYNKLLTFGTNSNFITANTSNTLIINSNGDINLNSNTKISIPNQTLLTFNTTSDSIYTDSSYNLNIISGTSINLIPTNYVSLPNNIPLIFGNINQNISNNNNGDLIVNAYNNILLNPGSGLDVRIPTGNALKLGGSGNQRISSDVSNNLFITATSDIFLSPSPNTHVNIPSNIPLTFYNYSQYIYADTNGNLISSAQNQIINNNQVYINNTQNSTCATIGSIHTNGGLGVKKDIVCESSVIINSQNTESLNILNSSGIGEIFVVNSANTGKINIYTGDGTSTNPSLEIYDTSLLNAKSLIQLKGAFDLTDSYMIGRGTINYNSGRALTINIPSYTSYNSTGSRPKFSIMSNECNTELFSIESDTGNIFSLGTFSITNTTNAINPTTGSFNIYGGLGVVKDIYTAGDFISKVNSLTAFQINNSTSTLLNIDSVNNIFSLNTNIQLTIQSYNAFSISDTFTTRFNIDTVNNILTNNLTTYFTNSTDSISTSSGSIICNGGVAIQKNLQVGGTVQFYNGLNMYNSNITNLQNPIYAQDAATKAYVDLVKQGLYVKDSVQVATVSPLNLSTDFIVGSTIDNYVLTLGDRILIKNQSDPVENGLYTITNSIPLRTLDLQDNTNAAGIFVFVMNGNTNKNLGFICNSPDTNDNVGSVALNFTEFTGLGQVHADALSALSINFNNISVNVDNVSIEINSNNLRIASGAVGTGLTGGSGIPLETTTDQSHVTKLGTINTGIWQGSVVQVAYGGTGQNNFNNGNILFGNGSSSINTDSKLYYNNSNVRLGLGTNNPQSDLHIKRQNTVTLLIESDQDSNNTNARPQLEFTYSGASKNAFIGMTRHINDFALNSYADAFIISNNQTDSTSVIQFATDQTVQMTILSNGNVGINTTNPQNKLEVEGSLLATDIVNFTNTAESTCSTIGAVILQGGLSINLGNNSSSPENGGSLTVNGGAGISQNLYVGGDILVSGSIIGSAVSSTTLAYLTITATDGAINQSTGSLITFGGITIQSAQDANSVTDGGSFLTQGGVGIGKSLFVGGNTKLKNLLFISSNSANYIQSPNVSQTTNSFLPINFTLYNNTSASIFTTHSSGIILNNENTLRIGGGLTTPNGYTFSFNTTGNFNIVPNENGSNGSYNLNIGTQGSLSNLNIFGNTGNVAWQSSTSNLVVFNASINFTNNSTNILFNSNTNGTLFINGNGSNGTLNLGQSNSIGSQLTTILSNYNGNSNITFTPNSNTDSSLIMTNVISTFNSPIITTDRNEYSGNALHQTLNNSNNSGNWIYFGQINNTTTGYCEIDFNNGVSSTNNLFSGLKVSITINSTTCNVSHMHYGVMPFNSTSKPICYIYQDTSLNYQLFTLLSPNSQTNVNVLTQQNTKFLLINEGLSAEPNGNSSGYVNTWTKIYSTNIESTLKYTFGDTTIEGQSLIVADNLPIIGYNNSTTTNSRDLGLLFQRYQIANDSGLGDIVNDAPSLIDSIPSQSTVPINQLKLSSFTSSIDDFYNGYWIKIFSGTNADQVRQIISYNGTQRVATLSSSFTSTNPNNGATVYLYNNTYVTNYYDEVNDTFSLSYTSSSPNQGVIVNNNNANLRLNHLLATDTTVSINASTGALYLHGGIAISNTNNAQSSTYGGTITTLGGVGIAQDLRVGNDICIGTSNFTPEESIHIRKTTSTTRFEHNLSSYSYIDFVENNTNNRYGILDDSNTNLFSLTFSNSNQNPYASQKALTINNSGYIGINTTSNIVSPLSLNSNNFISTNSTTGFLGLIGSSTNTDNNTNAARIKLNANGNTTLGNLELHAGSNGSINMFTSSADKSYMTIDNIGTVNILSTAYTKSGTTGALIVSGGISVRCTENATSLSSGGALLVEGGASINKDLYLGGNLYITGNLNASGAVTSPVITFPSTTNCTVIQYYNNNLITIGSSGVFTFALEVTPSSSSTNCELQFTLPGRSNALISRGEAICAIQGWTDDTNLYNLYNILCVGDSGTPYCKLKFQSASTNTHYFTIQVTYTIA
jgi:hypothetical protein